MTRRGTLGRRFPFLEFLSWFLGDHGGQSAFICEDLRSSAKICGKDALQRPWGCNTDGAEDNAHDLHV